MPPAEMGGYGGGSAEGTPLRRIERSEARKSPDRREWPRGGGGPGLEIRVARPEFLSSSSAETPMSCEQGRETAGEDPGGESPRALSPNSRPIGRRGRWRGGGGGSPNRGTASRGRIPPQNEPTEGADLRRGTPSEGLHLRLLAIPPDRRTRRGAGRDGPGFSIGRRSLGSAPIEDPRPSSDSG